MSAAEVDQIQAAEQILQQNGEDQDDLNSIQKLKNDLKLVIDKLNEVCLVNTKMLQKIAVLSEENDELYDSIREHKLEMTNLNQYGRRENVEFCNVPENIEQSSLEKHIIAVMDSIGVKVASHNIVAVHRIGKKNRNRPRNVIIRFVNRKSAFSILKNKKKLNTSNKYKNYYIIENLCPYNKKIFNTLYKHKKQEEIHSVWSFNGQVYAKVGKDDEPTLVSHLDEIDDLFYEESALNESEYGDDGGAESNNEPLDESVDANKSTHSANGNNGQGRNFSTPFTKTSSRRRLSNIAEEELSVAEMRTPIAPLVIKI